MRKKYIKEELEEIVMKSFSIADVCRYLGIRPVGGSYKTLHMKFIEFNISTNHFTGEGWRRGSKIPIRKPKRTEDLLIENCSYNSTKLKIRLLKEEYKESKCEICNNTEWMDKPIKLEIHHINGNNLDNRIENISILCPNCHSYTDNFRGKKKTESARNEKNKEDYNNLTIEEIRIEKQKVIKEIVLCDYCNKEIKNTRSCKKFCSRDCYVLSNRERNNIPKVPELMEKFKELKSFLQVGKFYNVTDNSVRKWCKSYGIMEMIKTEIDQMSVRT